MARSAASAGPSIGKVCYIGGEGVVWSKADSFFKCPCVKCVHSVVEKRMNTNVPRSMPAVRFQHSSDKEGGGLPTKKYFGISANDMMIATYSSQVFVKEIFITSPGFAMNMTPHFE